MSQGIVKYEPMEQDAFERHRVQFINQLHHYSEQTQIEFIYAQLSTGAAVEIEQKTGTQVDNIGKTELTLVLEGDADNASTLGKIYTAVYKDNAGVLHTTSATGTATLNATPVAFDPALADFYCFESFSASAVDANVAVIAKVAAGATYATISTATLAATEAQMLGVGAVYGRYHTNHNDYDDSEVDMIYETPWGDTKFCKCLTDGTDSTTEIRFFIATVVGKVFTATSESVKDFYRKRTIYTSKDPNAGHTWLLTDAACANIDGSGGDVYGMIEEGYNYSIHSAYYCSPNHDATLHRLTIFNATTATNYITIAITCTPKGHNKETTLQYVLAQAGVPYLHLDLDLEPDSDISFTQVDAAAASTPTFQYTILEAKNSDYDNPLITA